MSKKKIKKPSNVIDFVKHQHEKDRGILYDVIMDSFDDMADMCLEMKDILKCMREAAEEALTEAGLNFSNFKLTYESAAIFHELALFWISCSEPIFEYENDEEEDDKEFWEYLEDEPFLLEWQSTSKNGIEYSVCVSLEESADDVDVDDISVALRKIAGNIEWMYDFSRSVWISLTKDDDDEEE